MTTPLIRYGFGLLIGFLAAISITGGMFIVFVPVTIAVCVFIAATRSIPAFAGALTAFGATWVVLIGTTYLGCMSLGPDCVSSGGELAFIGVGFALIAGGLILTSVLILESKRLLAR